MLGELISISTPFSNFDGDFTEIARNGKAHFAIASTVLVAQCALAVFLAMHCS